MIGEIEAMFGYKISKKMKIFQSSPIINEDWEEHFTCGVAFDADSRVIVRWKLYFRLCDIEGLYLTHRSQWVRAIMHLLLLRAEYIKEDAELTLTFNFVQSFR
jgi:hypothetical protein